MLSMSWGWQGQPSRCVMSEGPGWVVRASDDMHFTPSQAAMFGWTHSLEVVLVWKQANGCPVPGCPVPGCPVPGCPVPGCPVPGCPVPGCPVPGCPVLGCPVLGCAQLPCAWLPCSRLPCARLPCVLRLCSSGHFHVNINYKW